MSFEIKPSINLYSVVNSAVNNIIDAAPATLDTLNELASALNDDANFATTVTNAIAAKAEYPSQSGNSGRYLSTNGFSVSWQPVSVSVPQATPTSYGSVYGRTASNNTSLGFIAANSNTTGTYNTAIGYAALYSNQTSFGNVAVGVNSLYSSTANANTAVGYYASSSNTTGSSNVAVGYSALLNNQTAYSTTAIGAQALLQFTSGYSNTAVGTSALSALTSGSDNVAVGEQAGFNLSSGSNNIIIGRGAESSSSSVSNQITLGNSSITTIRAQVTSITSLSDARDKKNIESLTVGLDFVDKLNPVKFDWDMRDGGKVDVPDTGFIAQDLVKLEDDSGLADYLKLTYRDNPDKLEASYGRLVPILVKAIQELSVKVNKLEEKLNG